MSVINTNVNAIIARNAGAVNERSMTKAMQQLSTGKRINVAADDAAGLAISTKMTSQVRGLDQAVRNANDGISMLQVLEGATVEMTNMLQRMRELAVQSSNDTNTSTERSYLNDEFQQLSQEINRIANTTQWNGVNVMTGSGTIGTAYAAGSTVNGASADADLSGRIVKFQAGANANQTIDFQIGSFNVTSGGSSSTATTETLNFGSLSTTQLAQYKTIELNDGTNSYSVSLAGTNFATTNTGTDAIAAALQTAIQGETDLSDVTVTKTGDGLYELSDDQGRDWTVSFTTTATNITSSVSATDVGAAAGGTAAEIMQYDFGSLSLSKVGTFTFTAGGNTFSVDTSGYDDTSVATWAADLEDDLQLLTGIEGSTVTAGATGNKLIIALNDGTDPVAISAVSWTSAEDAAGPLFDGGIGVAEVLGTSSSGTGVFRDASLGNKDITTTTNAQTAIGSLDTALNSLNEQRSAIGATINRLNYAADNLTNTSANVTAARSRVLDTDYAAATTELARTQIIQQASTAMLAQANQGAQSVLSLLK